MFAVEVREHIMVAHSFRGDVFGPAQSLHGATFVIEASFQATELDTNNLVIDIGAAHRALRAVIEPLNYTNLDDHEEFAGQNTTTEYLARYICETLGESARRGDLGRPAGELDRIRVTLSESHVARAWYEKQLAD